MLAADDHLLVLNCHEAWVHQLDGLPCALDLVVGLSGRPHAGWDERMRPLPRRARVLRLDEARARPERWTCAVAHNLTDLLDLRALQVPKLLVLHSTLEGRLREERSSVPPREMRRALHAYLARERVHAVAVSPLKARSWGGIEHVMPNGVDVDAYRQPTLELACGLRISNFLERRRAILALDFAERAFAGLPLRLVGHNPGHPDARAAESWGELKALLAAHRFYVHTADPELEDGFNLASLEAMAAGLPVLGNANPSSPIVHGESGFTSDDAHELARGARALLEDRELALRMGAAARARVARDHSLASFRAGFELAIERACALRATPARA